MNKWARVVLVFLANLSCILLLQVPIFLVNRYSTPHIRGFDPTNPANALPYKPDTVTPLMSAMVSFSTSLVPIIIMEIFLKFYLRHKQCQKKPTDSAAKFDFVDCCHCSWAVWVAIGRIFASYFAGYAITGLTTDIIKFMVARPRPSFLHMCQPDYTKSYPACAKCGSASSMGNFWPMCPTCPFIPPDMAPNVCMQENWYISRNMWLSFPSGHSSYTFYCGTFVALYLFWRLARFPVVIFSVVALRPLIVFASLLFSLYVGVSRISDDRHHATDVIGGALIGIFVGIFCTYFIAFASVQNLPGFLTVHRDCPSRVDNNDVETAKNEPSAAVTEPCLPDN